MPKGSGRNNQPRRTKSPRRDSVAPKPFIVKDLLHTSGSLAKALAQVAEKEGRWRVWLDARLPGTLRDKMESVIEQRGVITVFARSPAWAARLKFALEELWPQLQATEPRLTELRVKVSSSPGAGSSPKAGP